MSALQDLLDGYRRTAQTHREAGTYFEELTAAYFRTEPSYKELYREVLTYADWAKKRTIDKRDTGIDLVAETVTGEVHAIQCKLYAADYVVQKSDLDDLDSFFTASGKKPFSRRIIVATTDHFGVHAEAALEDQQPPVTKIDLAALEESVIDWASFKPKKSPKVRAKKSPRPHQKAALDAVLRGLKTSDVRGALSSCMVTAISGGADCPDDQACVLIGEAGQGAPVGARRREGSGGLGLLLGRSFSCALASHLLR